MILNIILLIIIFLIISHIVDMLNYNKEGQIIEINNKEKIKPEIKNKNPFLYRGKYQTNYTIDSLHKSNPGYIINDNNKLISLELLHKSDVISIHKNKNLVQGFNMEPIYEEIYGNIRDYLDIGIQKYLSIYKGKSVIELSKNIHNILLFTPLQGTIIFYLFNPKHYENIKGYEINKIKKWGIRLELSVNETLYIPPEWLYIYETNNESLVTQIEGDTIFTYVYNFIRSH